MIKYYTVLRLYKRNVGRNITLLFCLLISLNHIRAETFSTQTNEPSPIIKGSWAVVVLPDTQNYVKSEENFPILNTMMDWIVAEKEKRNIQMVVHVGDMTDNNSHLQWERVRSSYAKLDSILPYVVCVGNHDEELSKNKTSKLNDHFKIADNPLNEKIVGGSFEPNKLQNAYYLTHHNGQEFLFLALEYETRAAVIEWADTIIKKHPDHHVFITVHKYMTEASRLVSEDGRPDPQSKRGKGNDDAEVFARLAKPNPNVEFIVCGHVYAAKEKKGDSGKDIVGYEGVLIRAGDVATGHRSDTKENGLSVHQVLFNAQWIRTGGDGWFLLFEFSPDNKEVVVKTFSPHLGLWRTGPEYVYTLNRLDNTKKNSGTLHEPASDKE